MQIIDLRHLPDNFLEFGLSDPESTTSALELDGELMALQFTVNLVDLRRAVRRLTMRLADELAIGVGFVILRVAFNQLTIETLNSAEELTAEVHQAGTANVAVAVFCALAKTLRYHHQGRQIRFCISSGSIGVDRTVTRHPGISVT
jgi:hypothetical protein